MLPQKCRDAVPLKKLNGAAEHWNAKNRIGFSTANHPLKRMQITQTDIFDGRLKSQRLCSTSISSDQSDVHRCQHRQHGWRCSSSYICCQNHFPPPATHRSADVVLCLKVLALVDRHYRITAVYFEYSLTYKP